ncbi:hypothetical protein [Sulfuricurvum sp.]|uniref:hypothetical protein n=1 Tax=Sulfuricurvum sp. TaxID=2025608 RepID=UPI00262AC9B1|nr:hypothetical protein [Sulfuricurvum sp.]MDD2265701.1 hypothetical protein [Sulfuricurvum sp.]MDD2784010.1 hypothetical protein [Sulfuricurvum sp.]
MRTELQTFIDEIDHANNFSGQECFDYLVLKAVANLFGGNIPTNEVLAEVYSELQRIEGGVE